VICSFEYKRDPVGNPVGNPVSIVREDASVVYYEYDAKHQLTRETQRDSEGQDLYAWEWDYDAAGNRTYQTFNGVTTYYTYDAANELTEETTDGVTTYYRYDRCGNTTAKQEPTGTTYYHWDYENLLTQIDLPDGAHNYFTYDADSKRVSKQDSEGYTEFVYQGPDMLKLLLERDDQGETQAHYTMGEGLEAMRRANGDGIASGASSFYHFDALGSTFELTDGEEDVTDTYLYNAWGEALERTGSTVNPHVYVGKERYYLTPDVALYLLGLRYYDMALGRLVSVNPTTEELNWFLYVANHAVRLVHPIALQGKSSEASPSKGDCEKVKDFPYWRPVDDAIRHMTPCKGNPIGLQKMRQIVRCIIWGETGETDSPTTTNPESSARGLMQITRRWNDTCCIVTGRDFSQRENWSDPKTNIDCGVWLLCWCLKDRGWNTHKCKWLFNAIDIGIYDECRKCF